MNLTGKVLAITGASGILGQAAAMKLGAYGARLALLDHSSAAPGAVPGDALHFGGIDLSRDDAARSVMQQIVQQTGRLDGLINIAGGFHWEKLEGGTLDSWDSMYRLNLRTAVASCQAALPYLLQAGGGSIVNVGAMGASRPAPGWAPTPRPRPVSRN
jgi:NAD(P)-dependent dehydrogenase (short-subunit alcohol dehydrogenase family)